MHYVNISDITFYTQMNYFIIFMYINVQSIDIIKKLEYNRIEFFDTQIPPAEGGWSCLKLSQ